MIKPKMILNLKQNYDLQNENKLEFRLLCLANRNRWMNKMSLYYYVVGTSKMKWNEICAILHKILMVFTHTQTQTNNNTINVY